MSAQKTQPEAASRPLPPGWRWVRLGEVCELNYGESLPAHLRREGPIPVYGSNGIVGYHDRSVTQGATVIIGRKGSVGEVHFCNGPCWPIDTTYYIDRTKIEADIEWLSYWLRALGLSELNKAAAIPGLNRHDAYNLLLPLPPLSEQKRIAAILREQMAAVERARRAAEEQLEAVKALRAAYLRAVFPGPTEPLPDGWRWVRLGEVCVEDRKIVEPNSNLAQTLPYLSLEHIESNSGRILKHPNEPVGDEGKSTTFAFDSRHVLYGKLRPYLNKVALPDFAGRCTTEIIPLLPTEQVDREFLCWLLRRPETVEAAMREKTGSRMPRANMRELMKIHVPLPPLSEQKRIAAILREQMAQVDRLRKALEEQLDTINKLPAALLREAFSGRL